MTAADKERELQEYLKGESRLSRLYREAASEAPPGVLDRKLLDAARAATRPRHAWSPFASHWFVPVSMAVVLVLVVGIYIFSTVRVGTPGLNQKPVPMAGDVATPPATERSNRVAAERKQKAEEGRIAEAPSNAPSAPSEPAAARTEESAASRLSPSGQSKAVAPASAGRPADIAKQAPALVAGGAGVADIVSVTISGAPGAFYFDVGVRSKDTGCRQYADWWEVVSEDGRLLYRRVLLHSHVDEQPFVRGGGPVPIQPDTIVWIRAHMNPGGYGGVAFRGSLRAGFRAATLASDFAADLASASPLPDGCAF